MCSVCTMSLAGPGKCWVVLRCKRSAVSSSNQPAPHQSDFSAQSPWPAAALPCRSRFAATRTKTTTRQLSKDASHLLGTDTQPTCNIVHESVCIHLSHPPELIQGAQHLLQLGHLLSGGCSLAVPIQVLGQLWKEMTSTKTSTKFRLQTQTLSKTWWKPPAPCSMKNPVLTHAPIDSYLLHSSESCNWNQSRPVGSPASSFFAPYPETQSSENLRRSSDHSF